MKLDDPRMVKWLWAAGLVILVAVMVVDAFVPHHPHFERDGVTIDTLPEFFPLYGFLSGFVMVVVAKAIGVALTRKDNFYGDD